MTAQQMKKMGRPRKLAEDQAKLGARLEQRDLAIIDMRSRGEKGRSEALRDLLRRYSAIIDAATPRLSSRTWSFAIYALQGVLDEEANDTPELVPTFDMSPGTIRTTLRDELGASVPPDQIEQAWSEYPAGRGLLFSTGLITATVPPTSAAEPPVLVRRVRQILDGHFQFGAPPLKRMVVSHQFEVLVRRKLGVKERRQMSGLSHLQESPCLNFMTYSCVDYLNALVLRVRSASNL